MKGSETFKNTIHTHLKKLAAQDEFFSDSFQKPHKTLDGCINYILETVQKSGINGFEDSEIFGMAVHYYDEDTVKDGKPTSCKVIVNHQVQLTPEEIAQAKQDALEKIVSEEKQRLYSKISKKKEVETDQSTLF